MGIAASPIPVPAAAQVRASLAGRVLDTRSRAPIQGARVFITGLRDTLTSDAAGRFAADSLAPGAHVLEVRAIGYEAARWTLELLAGPLAIAIELESRLPLLDTLRLAARQTFDDPTNWRSPSAFELRRQKGFGQFLTSDVLSATPARSLGEILRTVPGVMVACRGAIGRCDVRLQSSVRGPCPPSYVLDGYPATNATGPDFPLVRIHAIEIYRAHEVPAELQIFGDRCGVIAIWTRMER